MNNILFIFVNKFKTRIKSDIELDTKHFANITGLILEEKTGISRSKQVL